MITKNWSAALEHGEYAEDRDLVVKDGIEAVGETGKGVYVNLVTPNEFGNPDTYLTDILLGHFGEEIREIKYIDECGCGGHVLRVYK
ncbi:MULTISPECIES: CGCGG family rSAM-modified RiPP protein [Bacillaceae]|uniref:CGCGG family rSAM-modified RiPP protein n=1 Tax=Evansella alkalicola TaxID=745819 RepID=A0ABS6JUF8_9BACI|nr:MULTISPECIES: CGCGG family rSAM-modified RiPP protein [Bacillaceae]MBU9720780.1 CGCGG family rSAM-modified RiPP protein [Bacillus alkalicola]